MSGLKGLVVVLTMIAGTAGIAPASLISVFYDPFDEETLGLGKTALSNWTVTAGNVDVIGASGSTTLYDLYPGHGKYLDLDGTATATVPSGQTNATIRTTAVFSPGLYMLTFLLGNNPGGGVTVNNLTVTIDSSVSQTWSTTDYPPMTLQTASFYVPTSGPLTFIQTGPADGQGSIIDDVHLYAVPEPSAQLLIGSGLVALGFLVRRVARSA